MQEDRQTPKEDIQAQTKILRSTVAAAIIGEVSTAMRSLMSRTYTEVFGTPKRLKGFVLPLTTISQSNGGNQKAAFPTIMRKTVVDNCSQETAKRLTEQAKCAGGMNRFSVDYQRIPREIFDKIVGQEIDRRGAEMAGPILAGLDIAAWFKVNMQLSAQENYENTYKLLCGTCPNLQKKNVHSWSSLCSSALRVRNDYIGHISDDGLKLLMEKGLRKTFASFLEIAELLHCPAVNEAEYKTVQETFDQGESRLHWQVISFDDLQVSDLTHQEIRQILKDNRIDCQPDCALYKSREALSECLQQIRTAYQWVPLTQIQEFVGDGMTMEECEEAFRTCDVKVENGKAFCSSVDQLFGILSMAQDQRTQRQRAADLAEAEQQLRQELNLTNAELEKLRQDAQFRQQVEERVAARELKTLPRLNHLCSYEKGKLSADQLQELVSTHQLVLDPSVLRDAYGRRFITNELVPCMQILRSGGREVYFMVEATARYHLYKDYEAYKAAERAYNQEVWTAGREQERAAAKRRLDEMKSAGAAYLCMEDALHGPGLLRYVGIPSQESSDEESLRRFLEQNPALRVCVLTSGASRLPEVISHQEFPLCVVARVQRELPHAGGVSGTGQLCRIFPQYLPLVDGTGSEDLMDAFRRCYRVSAENYLVAEKEARPEENLPAENQSVSGEHAPAVGTPEGGTEAVQPAPILPAATAQAEEPAIPAPAVQEEPSAAAPVPQAVPKPESGEAAVSAPVPQVEPKLEDAEPAAVAAAPEKAALSHPALSQNRHGSRRTGAFRPAFPPVSELRQVQDQRLPLSRPVEAGDTLVTETGLQIRLTGRLREDRQEVEGGEGVLYCVDAPGQVAKIYHTSKNNYKLTSGRREKLEDMIAHNPGIKGLCWPTHLLYNQTREFVGYLMPLAPAGALSFQRSVMQMTKRTVCEELLPGWDRLDLVRTAQAVAGVVERLHQNNILVGDINDGNFMVDPKNSSKVYLVDCDSYQFDGYPCPVGTMDYTHPNTAARLGVSGDLHFGEFLRLEEEENYTLGILIFRILMLGQYPFSTRSGMTPAQAMREKIFPYTADEVDDIPEGESWMIWKNMPQKLTAAFLRTFKEWDAPSAAEWEHLLRNYVYSIENYGFSRELAPVKYHEFHPEDPFFVDVTCELDGVEFNMPIKLHKWLKRNHQHILCHGCKSALARFEKQPERLKCDQCGKWFQGNMRQAYLREKLGDKCYCEDCENVTFTCDGCGKEATISRADDENRRGDKRFCEACRKTESHVCEVCGKEYHTLRGSYLLTKQYQNAAMCPDCRSAKELHPTCCVCGEPFSLENNRWLLRRRYVDGRGFFCLKDLPSASPARETRRPDGRKR